LSFQPPGRARPPDSRAALRSPRWPRYLVPAVLGLIALIVVLTIVAGVWSDFLWFRSVHYSSVFAITYGTRWALFFVTGLFMALVTGVNAVIAFRLRPEYRPVPAGERPGMDLYRQAVDPHRRLLLGLVLFLVGLLSGLSAAGAWQTWLLFANQVPFGVKDPQFGLDISFFVFTYPFLRLVLGYLFTAVLLSLAAVLLVNALYGGLRVQGRRLRATAAAQTHLFLLLGVFVLLKGVAYWIDRYGIDFSQRGTVTTGASYTDVNAVLPAKTVLAIIAVLCAVLFFAGALRRSAALPAVGFGLLVLSAVLIGGVYPAIIQQFVVKPNELAKESRYIHREITGTRRAYAVSGARVISYPGASVVPLSQLTSKVAGLSGLRLMDPAVVSQTFQQLQQVKGFYQFPSMLAVDRYILPSSHSPQDVVVAVRGMGGPPPGQGNWINTHLVYTHGFGVVAAKADAVAADGTPSFVESDIPPHGQLGPFQPRVYFGQQQNTYAIVGAPPGRPPQELDYPYENASGQQNNTYQGNGGVPVGSPLNRLLYAIKFRELNILLSGAINGDSKILYDRQPLARVAKVAPFLTLDANPYPVVAAGRILWVVDGYTTTDMYPYSERISLTAATATSQAANGAVAGQAVGQINYLRNSVKAVVDAYTGAVTLYQWGPSDPLLRTWMNAFPGIIKPRSDIPAYLLPHLRYPPDLFEVQRQILAKYHVTNPQSFYGGQNFWTVPNDPTGVTTASGLNQPPYYLTMAMPGYRQQEFSLTTTMAQRSRPNLAAYIAVDSNPQAGYGTIRVLQLPQEAAILGPQQVQNNFESDTVASKELSLFRQGGSTVIKGDLIALPLAGGLLFEEPIYIEAAGGASAGSYPTLKRVFVFFDGQVGYGPTLPNALGQVFAGLPSTGPALPSGSGQVSAAVRRYLAQAEQDYAAAQAALKSGDFAAYGQDIANMKAALDNAQRAAGATPAAAPSPSASPTPTR
jgi:uncharacterized membrane protein (UPF0182 family)